MKRERERGDAEQIEVGILIVWKEKRLYSHAIGEFLEERVVSIENVIRRKHKRLSTLSFNTE